MTTSTWALPALHRSPEDAAIYRQVEAAVAAIIAGTERGEFTVTDYPDLVVLVRIIYPAFHVKVDGRLGGLHGSSLP